MDLRDLINKSRLHRDIVSFFNDNPAAIDTPRGIATWVRGDNSKVEYVLEDLVTSGIVIADRTPSTVGYSYTSDPKIIAKVKHILGS